MAVNLATTKVKVITDLDEERCKQALHIPSLT
jgi:hypothetical protein